MEKTQLKEKVQKHVDSLFLTLSQNLDVQVSEDVQNRFTNWLSQEAFSVLLAQKKQGLVDATEKMFAELQNDLGMTFREATKSDLLEILLAEAGVSFEDNPTEVKPKDVSSDKPEIHSEEKSEAETNAPQAADEAVQEAELKEDKPEAQEKLPQEAETNAPQVADETVQKAALKEDKSEAQEKLPKVAETNASQVADETVQKADKVVTNKNSGKPWTEECHDPEIIRKVNVTFACYYKGDLDKKQYSRDMKVEHAFASNSSKRESFGRDIEGMFNIRFGKSVYSFWETLGDVYDSVFYCLKQGIVERQTSGKIDKQEVYGVKKLWGDYKVDPSDSSPKVRKIVDMVNQTLIDKLDIEQDMITRESRFKDDLGADSLDSVEFIMECEKAFNFYIPDDVSEQIQTVGDAYDCLYYYLKE